MKTLFAPYTGSLDLKHNAELGQGLSEDVAVYAGNFTYGVAAGAIGLPDALAHLAAGGARFLDPPAEWPRLSDIPHGLDQTKDYNQIQDGLDAYHSLRPR